MEFYNIFEKENHLRPVISKSEFENLHGWDFGWTVLKGINIAPDEETEKELSKKFSPGQKALYFFWYLDAQVTNGGFIQFYWNGYRMYLPIIIEGLKLICDKELLDLIELADKEYSDNKEKFELQKKQDDWEPLYDQLTKFDKYDSVYYKIHNTTMELLEKYIRLNQDQFVILE
jgi:hypothetical protein